jgi:hypothetical protein
VGQLRSLRDISRWHVGWYSLCRSTKMVRQQKVRITTTSERAKHYLGAPQPGLPVFLGRLRHVGHWRMPSPCVHCRGVSEIRRGPPCANMGCQYCCSAIGLVKYDGVRVRPDGLRSTGLRSTLIDVAQGECKYVLRSLHEPQLIDLQAHQAGAATRAINDRGSHPGPAWSG